MSSYLIPPMLSDTLAFFVVLFCVCLFCFVSSFFFSNHGFCVNDTGMLLELKKYMGIALIIYTWAPGGGGGP